MNCVSIKSRITCFFLFLHLGYQSFGNELPTLSKGIRFNKYDSHNGIPGETIKCIFQDQSGLIWLGVEFKGLVSFDGNSFDQYGFDPANDQSLSNNIVQCIAEDKDGNLWVGTKEGLNRRSKTINHNKQNQFTRFTHSNVPSTIPHNQVNVLYLSKKYELLIGTDRGLCVYKNKETFESIPLNDSSEPPIRCIYQKQSGEILIGTTEGIFLLNQDYEKIGHYPFREARGRIQDIIEDSMGRLWVGTRSGLYIYLDGQFQFINHILREGQQFESLGIDCLYKDHRDRIWVGSISRGLYIFYPNGNHYEFLTHEVLSQNGFQGDQIRDITQDSQGLIWVGTKNEGMYVQDYRLETFGYLNTQSSPLKLNHNSVLSIFESRDQQLYIGTRQGGLNVISRQEEIEYFTHELGNRNSIGSDRVEAITEDSNGHIWIGSIIGLSRFDPITRTFKNYALGPIRALQFDVEGQLWLGTNRGPFKFDPKKESFSQPFETNPALHDDISGLLRDKDNNIWIATRNTGVFQYLAGKDSLRHYSQDQPNEKFRLPSNQARGFHQDSAGNIWVGTFTDGLLKLEEDSGTYHVASQHFGSIGVFSIVENEPGVFWLSTNKGVFEFNHRTGASRNFGQQYGLQGEVFINTAYLKSSTGYIFFGGNKGMNFFKPESIVKKTFIPSISIKSIITPPTASDNFAQDDRGVYHFEYGSYISVEFFLNDFSNPRNNTFRYKLQEATDEWINLGTKNQVSYVNMKPGTYNIAIQGANADGIWSQEPATIQFKILDPWWLSPYAKAAYLLSFFLILLLIYRFLSFRARKHHELKVIRLEKDQAEKINDEKLNFFTDISHELNTPLTIMLPSAEKLASTFILKPEDVKKHSSSLLRNLKLLKNLIEDLLEFRKIEQGHFNLNPTPTEVVGQCQQIISQFVPLAASKNIQYNFETNLDPLGVRLDQKVFEKVLNNLISNAFKYTPSGGSIIVSLRIKSPRYSVIRKKQTKGSDYIVLAVKDSGAGISKEDLPHIFERFYRSKAPKATGGSGIGLALVKSLVERHNGRVSIYSQLGKGSLFTVILPLEPAPTMPKNISPQPAVPIQRPDTHETALTHNQGKKLLIVEDDIEIQSILIDLFSDYEVVASDNGEDGLKIASQLPQPSLIISDVMMPVMDGLTFCSKIKGNFKTSHIPVLMLTAKATTQDQLEGIKVGADDYTTKPFLSEVLRAKVENLLERQDRLKNYFEKNLTLQPSDSPVYNREKELLIKCKVLIEQNISNENFSVQDLANELNMSRANLFRKLKYLINQSPLELIYTIRLKKAIDLIETSNHTMSEIAYTTGFSSPSSFSTTFKKYYKVSPKAYLNELTEKATKQ